MFYDKFINFIESVIEYETTDNKQNQTAFGKPVSIEEYLRYLSNNETDKFIIKINLLNHIFCSRSFFIAIPNYMNQWSTISNINLIKTAIVIYVKGIYPITKIHEIVLAFEYKCRQNSSETIPLNLRIINQTVRHLNIAIPKNLLLYWNQKCWQLLDCAVI